jgi:uncharacterized membrane protein
MLAAMAATAPHSGAPTDRERLLAAVRDARADAAPSALSAAGVLILLALVSRHASWELLGHDLWWIWLVVAAPYICLFGVLGVWRAMGSPHDRTRPIVIGLLTLVWAFTVLGVGLLVVSLVSHSGREITGRELLLSGAVVLFTVNVAFGLAFWELDCGGPVARALSEQPRKPDFQFPQDENPELASDDWSPRLWDYLYVSLTNSIAFSPTDTMPLTRMAKRLMAAESILSGITILLIAARAVNILA